METDRDRQIYINTGRQTWRQTRSHTMRLTWIDTGRHIDTLIDKHTFNLINLQLLAYWEISVDLGLIHLWHQQRVKQLI